MKIGEIEKGKNLLLADGDLVSKAKSVHLFFNGRICRPTTINGKKKRGERLWQKIGECRNFKDYERTVIELGGIPCRKCLNRLEKEGYIRS